MQILVWRFERNGQVDLKFSQFKFEKLQKTNFLNKNDVISDEMKGYLPKLHGLCTRHYDKYSQRLIDSKFLILGSPPITSSY